MKYFLVIFVGLLMVIVGYKFSGSSSASDQYVQRMEERLTSDFTMFKQGASQVFNVDLGQMIEMDNVYKSEEEWKKILTEQEFEIAFRQGTERPFTGELNANKKFGVYRSKVSGNDLFHSDHKFDSGTGWPSFFKPVNDHNIILKEDNGLIRKRTEVVDRLSGAHLGHVFADGPEPTGLRYCINSDALIFVQDVVYKEAK